MSPTFFGRGRAQRRPISARSVPPSANLSRNRVIAATTNRLPFVLRAAARYRPVDACCRTIKRPCLTCSVAIEQLGEGVVVLSEGGALSATLVPMTAVGTEPDDGASGPVAVVIDATG